MSKKLFTAGLVMLIVVSGLFAPKNVFADDCDKTAPPLSPDAPGIACTQGGLSCTISAGNRVVCLNSSGQATVGTTESNSSFGGSLAEWIFKYVGMGLMSISAGILALVGMLFDTVIKHTIVDMATNIGNDAGLGGAISSSWATLRDVANMAFIFILLYTAFKAMFELNFGSVSTTIRNIIIVALLINFSLFFTKVVIDASNVVAIGFYNSIREGNSYSFNSGNANENSTNSTVPLSGISGGYMRLVGIQSWYSSGILQSDLGWDRVLIIGVMSSVFMLITAVIFLVSGVMFLSRFIILIFLMVVSAPALVSYIIPGQKKHFDMWKDALINQSIFAPIFFAMTWVTFKLASAPNLLGSISVGSKDFTQVVTGSPSSSAGLIFNFVLVLGMAVASLVFSKSIAGKAAGFSTITTHLGAAGAGALAWGGRNSVGWVGNKFGNSNWVQRSKGKDSNFVKRTFARSVDYVGNKAANSTFDPRNASVPTSVIGDAIRGTVGRTGLGKKLGLNDVNIPSVAVGSSIIGSTLGQAGKKGYKELAGESDKRTREQEAEEKRNVKLAQNKAIINKGTDDKEALPGSTEVQEMEKALAKMSDKEVEAIIMGNRKLLESQNFANAISVRQLEAINKSDQYTDAEKGGFKDLRFKAIKSIDDSAGLAALAKPTASRSKGESEAAARVENAQKKVKALSDTELEMINPDYLRNTHFVTELNSSQIDHLNKSSKFTDAQKADFRNTRFSSINTAMATGGAGAASVSKNIRGLSDTELEMINPDYLRNDSFVEELTPSQLDAINKSKKFTDTQKSEFRNARFAPINTAMATGGAGAASVKGKIKGLSEAELEMINPDYLEDENFVSQLKASQIEMISKSKKFTATQIDEVKKLRKQPLENALSTGTMSTRGIPEAHIKIQQMGPKEIAALDIGILTNPLLVGTTIGGKAESAYSPGMLQKMALEMSTPDIQTLRKALITALPTGHDTRDWLEDKDTGKVIFS